MKERKKERMKEWRREPAQRGRSGALVKLFVTVFVLDKGLALLLRAGRVDLPVRGHFVFIQVVGALVSPRRHELEKRVSKRGGIIG